jgi:hypothetical protein
MRDEKNVHIDGERMAYGTAHDLRCRAARLRDGVLDQFDRRLPSLAVPKHFTVEIMAAKTHRNSRVAFSKFWRTRNLPSTSSKYEVSDANGSVVVTWTGILRSSLLRTRGGKFLVC